MIFHYLVFLKQIKKFVYRFNLKFTYAGLSKFEIWYTFHILQVDYKQKMDHYSFTLAERTIMTHITGSFIDEIGGQVITSFRSVLNRSDIREINFSGQSFRKIYNFVFFKYIHVGTL